MNSDILNKLTRREEPTPTSALTSVNARPSSFTGRLSRKSSVVGGDIDEFLAGIGNLLYSPPVAGIPSGVDADKFPVTQGMYRGETFSAPTFGTTGVIFPWEILEKRRAAKVQASKEIESKSLAMDYEIQEVKDEISNAVFVENLHKQFNDILSYYTEEFGGDKKKAIYYLNVENPNILKNEALRWKNFKSLFDTTWENYVKVITDTDAFGMSKYDNDSKAMADVFANLIADPDMLNPDAIENYNVFMGAFNERMSLVEIAKTASTELKGIWKEKTDRLLEENDYDVWETRKELSENFDSIAKDFLRMFGGLQDYTEEQRNAFMNVFKSYFVNDVISSVDFPRVDNISADMGKILFKHKLGLEEKAKKVIIIPNIGHQDINITNEDDKLISKAPVENYHDMSSSPVKFTGKAIGQAYNVTKGKYEDIPGGLTGEIVGVGKLEKSKIDIIETVEETEKEKEKRIKRGEPIPTIEHDKLTVRDPLNRIGYVRTVRTDAWGKKIEEYFIVDYVSVVSDVVRGEREGKYKFEDFDISEKGKEKKIEKKIEEGKVIKATKEQMEAAAKEANITSEEVIKYWESKGFKVEIISKAD